MEKRCKDCRHFYADDRETVYRRGEMFFCKASPYPMSRQYKPGEGSRVSPDMPACPRFRKNSEE